MKQLKVLLVSMVAVCAIGVVAAGGANAGSGYLYLGGPPCDMTFTNSGAPIDPGTTSITIDNVVEDGLDPDCAGIDVQNPATSLGINFAGTGLLTGSGAFVIRATPVPSVTCTFSATTYTGTNSANTAVINMTFNKTAGSFLCPSTAGSGYLAVTSF